MSHPQEKGKSPSLGEFAGLAAFLVGLITAWLYVAGWTYAYHYFDRFGVPLLMVDIPKEHYLVYGSIVVRNFPIWGLTIGVAGIAVFILWRHLGDMADRLRLPVGIVAVLALFWLSHQAAVVAAHEQYIQQRETDYGAYPRVQVWTRENIKSTNGAPSVIPDLAAGCYRLLLHNQNRLFLLRPLKGAPAADLPVLVLPWDQIELIRIVPDYVSCQ